MQVELRLGTIDVEQEGEVLVIRNIPAEWTVELEDFEPGTFEHEGDTVRLYTTGAVDFWGKGCGYSYVLWGAAGVWGTTAKGMVLLMPRCEEPDAGPESP